MKKLKLKWKRPKLQNPAKVAKTYIRKARKLNKKFLDSIGF